MHTLNLQLPDPLYAEIARAATASGQSVEVVVIERLTADFGDEAPAGLWTLELLASLDTAVTEADQNGGLTLNEIGKRRTAKSKAWREAHPA